MDVVGRCALDDRLAGDEISAGAAVGDIGERAKLPVLQYHERVVSAVVEKVAPLLAEKLVEAGAAINCVVSPAAMKYVVARAAIDVVLQVPAGQNVGPLLAEEANGSEGVGGVTLILTVAADERHRVEVEWAPARSAISCRSCCQ